MRKIWLAVWAVGLGCLAVGSVMAQETVLPKEGRPRPTTTVSPTVATPATQTRVQAPRARGIAKPGSLSVNPADLPATEPFSFQIEMTKRCSSGKPCWLEATIALPMAGMQLSGLQNINPRTLLWLPYPGHPLDSAPHPVAGLLLEAMERIDQTVIGIPANYDFRQPLTVRAVPFCPSSGQPRYCEHESAFLRIHYQPTH